VILRAVGGFIAILGREAAGGVWVEGTSAHRVTLDSHCPKHLPVRMQPDFQLALAEHDDSRVGAKKPPGRAAAAKLPTP
jgi:hypothetical protein